MSDNLPGVQWIPIDSDDGIEFIERHCIPCGRDRPTSDGVGFDECLDSEICPILSASFRDEAMQWRRLDDGELICTEYQKHKPIANPSQGELI